MQYFKDQYLGQFYLLKIVISRNILQKFFFIYFMQWKDYNYIAIHQYNFLKVR